MTIYIIGFITCFYALITHWSSGSEDVSLSWQFKTLAFGLAYSLIWPICLAVWMRDIKKP